MAKGAVADVVEQGGHSDEAALGIFDAQFVSQLSGNMRDTQRMIKASVQCSWIHQRFHCQLPYSTQTLQDIQINYLDFVFIKRDEIVDRVTKLDHFMESVAASLPQSVVAEQVFLEYIR